MLHADLPIGVLDNGRHFGHSERVAVRPRRSVSAHICRSERNARVTVEAWRCRGTGSYSTSSSQAIQDTGPPPSISSAPTGDGAPPGPSSVRRLSAVGAPRDRVACECSRLAEGRYLALPEASVCQASRASARSAASTRSHGSCVTVSGMPTRRSARSSLRSSAAASVIGS